MRDAFPTESSQRESERDSHNKSILSVRLHLFLVMKALPPKHKVKVLTEWFNGVADGDNDRLLQQWPWHSPPLLKSVVTVVDIFIQRCICEGASVAVGRRCRCRVGTRQLQFTLKILIPVSSLVREPDGVLTV